MALISICPTNSSLRTFYPNETLYLVEFIATRWILAFLQRSCFPRDNFSISSRFEGYRCSFVVRNLIRARMKFTHKTPRLFWYHVMFPFIRTFSFDHDKFRYSTAIKCVWVVSENFFRKIVPNVR